MTKDNREPAFPRTQAYAIKYKRGIATLSEWLPIFWNKKQAKEINSSLLMDEGKIVKVCILPWSEYEILRKFDQGDR